MSGRVGFMEGNGEGKEDEGRAEKPFRSSTRTHEIAYSALGFR